MRLKDKVALITGAAHGMGECTARLFCREGAKVVIADVLDAEGQKVAADLTAAGADCVFLRLDVSNEDQWQDVMRATIARHRRLDILVNNAGISGSLPDRMSTEHFDRLMSVNARGTFLGVKYAVPEMQKVGGGSIVIRRPPATRATASGSSSRGARSSTPGTFASARRRGASRRCP